MGIKSIDEMRGGVESSLPRDYLPVATPNDDVLPDTLGFMPRGVLCTAAGTLVVRFEGKDADRSIPVQAGQIVFGPVRQVKAGTDCGPFVIE